MRRISFVVDLEAYSRRTAPEQVDAQGRLLWSMVNALRAAGLGPATCARQDQGDGQLIILPAGINEAHVLPTVIRAVHSALHQVNSRPGRAGRLRMRMALAQGPVQIALTGYVGTGVVAACRMLDSDPPRKALKRNGDADLVVIVSDDLYDQVFSQNYDGTLGAPDFQPVQVVLRSKGYRARAWLHVPGARPAPGLVPDFTGAYEEETRVRWLAAAAVPAAGAGLWWASHDTDDLAEPADQADQPDQPDHAGQTDQAYAADHVDHGVRQPYEDTAHIEPQDPVDPTPDWPQDPVTGQEYVAYNPLDPDPHYGQPYDLDLDPIDTSFDLPESGLGDSDPSP
ncbi:hypothetical protein [Actinomadura chibensis]|uniref:hypothetical protein n=1 Tax=Actinomadura chibensis TaxID=392828 RepID=UPI0014725B79|nr:hypothetical protein [Actinomadura chibensis]